MIMFAQGMHKKWGDIPDGLGVGEAEHSAHHGRKRHLPHNIAVVSKGISNENVVIVGVELCLLRTTHSIDVDHKDLRERPRDALSQLILGFYLCIQPDHVPNLTQTRQKARG